MTASRAPGCVPSSYTDLLIEVVRAAGCPVKTYWLNVRPAFVVNEAMFDHASGFYGSFVELSGEPIGRGFHADSDDNASDFMEQIEPSPWMRNLTEVRR